MNLHKRHTMTFVQVTLILESLRRRN